MLSEKDCFKFWFGLVLGEIKHCRLLNAQTFLNVYIEYMISQHIL